MAYKQKSTYLTLVDHSLGNSKDLLNGVFSGSGYWAYIDFSSTTLQKNLDAISAKFSLFDGISLVTSSSVRSAQNVEFGGKKADFVWSGNLENLKEGKTGLSDTGLHTVFKWINSDNGGDKIDADKGAKYLGSKVNPSIKDGLNKKEYDLKEKFKTKEDYEAYLSKVKSDVTAKKVDTSKKEYDLKEKFKTKEDYEAYLSKVKSDVTAKKVDTSKKEYDLKEKFKTKEDYEAYLSKVKSDVTAKKVDTSKKEYDLKEKFKTKEDYEAYLSKVKSDVTAKKVDTSKKEYELKEKFKTKEDYEAYLSKVKSNVTTKKVDTSKKDISGKGDFEKAAKSFEKLEKGEVGFWKHHEGKKKLMKEFQVKIKDNKGKDVAGDFKISKDGKIDLGNLPSGKYAARLKLEANPDLLYKAKQAINIDDTMVLLSHIGKITQLSETETIAANADRSEDNDININDVMAVMRIIGGFDKVSELDLRKAGDPDSSGQGKNSEYFDITPGEVPALDCYLVGDVDGSFYQTLI